MKALRDIYNLKVDEPFKQLFTQGMITHKTYRTLDDKWIMPKDVVEIDGKLLVKETRKTIKEGPSEKMSKSKKNVIEPDEILENYGIDATRIFMVSDSPPDRELEWTDNGIQSSKNLIKRIEKYFLVKKTKIHSDTEKVVEKFILQLEGQLIDRNVTIEFSEDTLKWLAEEGYDDKMGARPISRKIQEHIKKPLSEALLFGELKKGGIVKLSVKNSKLDLDFKPLSERPSKKIKANILS